jgi:hypothetical protein
MTDNLPIKPDDIPDDAVEFIPSHLTKGLVAGAVTLVSGAYAAYQFKQVTIEEVLAFLRPPNPN